MFLSCKSVCILGYPPGSYIMCLVIRQLIYSGAEIKMQIHVIIEKVKSENRGKVKIRKTRHKF